MASTMIEVARQLHAQLEANESAIVKDLAETEVRTTKEERLQAHRTRKRILSMVDVSERLQKYYHDDDGSRAAELRVKDPFDEFYKAYSSLLDTPAQDTALDPMLQTAPTCTLEELDTVFRGEEFYGKYLDLHSHHLQAMNLEAFPKVRYVEYLQTFSQLYSVETRHKNEDYRTYLENLLQYLASFHERVYPLYPISRIHERIQQHIDEQAQQDPLFCSVCDKSFAKQSLADSHFGSKKHAKKAAKHGRESLTLLEESVHAFAALLQDRIRSTVHFIESMQTLTYEEMRMERTAESEEDVPDKEIDDENVIYNPKKVPLGWDGKPIPYWLYKLHGLNIEYKCEICGNHSYWGPRAYENHFQEWRHINNLKALGIYPSEEFKNITKIEDAVALHRKLERDAHRRAWVPDNDEEFEDAEGNVFNKKTYDDLRRQGLL